MKILLKTETSLLGYHYELRQFAAATAGRNIKESGYSVYSFKDNDVFDFTNAEQDLTKAKKQFDTKRTSLKILEAV